MPLPPHHVRNPLWGAGNGEPEYVPYGHPNLDLVDPIQPNSGSSSRTVQPLQVSPAGMPPNSGAPSNHGLEQFPTNIPIDNTFDLLNDDGPNSSLESPSAGFPADSLASSVSNTGVDADRPSWDATLAHVRALKDLGGMYYAGYVSSFEEHERFELALKHLTKRRNTGHSMDMPQDQAGQQQLARRLCIAMLNLDGIESNLTRNQVMKDGQNAVLDSIAVKCVKEMGPLKLEMLAWGFMRAIRDAQDGQLELLGDLNEGFKDFSTFMGRFVIVEEALRVNKNLVRDALNQGVNRIVADPAGQRFKKKENKNINKSKAEQIKLGRQALKGGAAALGTKRSGGPSTDTPTEKRTKLSTGTAPAVQTASAQPQMGFQQYQLPQQQGISPLSSQHHQHPYLDPNAYLQPSGMQPAQPEFIYGNPEQHGHVGDRGYNGQYGYPHGPPQQLGFPHPPENQPQTQDRLGLDNFQQQSGNPQQPAQQQVQQPTPMPGPISTTTTSPTTPGTHDGPQSS